MLLNISSDRILFYNNNECVILPYGELEQNLPDFLYAHINPTTTHQIVIINGPGSFTNLRIATLALNTMNMLHNFSLSLQSISKPTYLQNLYKVGGTPGRFCVMYIGQKKWYWVVDLAHSEEIIDEYTPGVKKIHIDDIQAYVIGLGEQWFVDELVAEGKECMDAIWGEGGYNMITYTEQDMPTIQGTQYVEPNYMITANIQ